MRRIINFRAYDEQIARWRTEAGLERKGLSDWFRHVLDEYCDQQEAERRRTEAQVQERKRLRDTAKGYY